MGKAVNFLNGVMWSTGIIIRYIYPHRMLEDDELLALLKNTGANVIFYGGWRVDPGDETSVTEKNIRIKDWAQLDIYFPNPGADFKLQRIYKTEDAVYAAVYNTVLGRVVVFSDIFHTGAFRGNDIKSNINYALYLYLNVILPILQENSIKIHALKPPANNVIPLLRRMAGLYDRLASLEARVEELEERNRELEENSAAAFIRALAAAAERVPAALAGFPGWRASDGAFVYTRPIAVKYAVFEKRLYKLPGPIPALEKLEIKIGDYFEVYASPPTPEGHPNVSSEGLVCLGDLEPYKVLSIPNLYTLLARLPTMLETANLDSAYGGEIANRIRSLIASGKAKPAAAFGRDTAEFEVSGDE